MKYFENLLKLTIMTFYNALISIALKKKRILWWHFHFIMTRSVSTVFVTNFNLLTFQPITRYMLTFQNNGVTFNNKDHTHSSQHRILIGCTNEFHALVFTCPGIISFSHFPLLKWNNWDLVLTKTPFLLFYMYSKHVTCRFITTLHLSPMAQPSSL